MGQVSTGLSPLISEQSRILVLGSYPSRLSLEKREYYAHPQNQFWRIMEALFEIPVDFSYKRRTRMLLTERVALWDILFSCTREGSSDASISGEEANDIPGILHGYPGIQMIILNGRAAEKYLHRFYPALCYGTDIEITYLPSSSPAHARMTLSEKISCWEVVKQAAERESDG